MKNYATQYATLINKMLILAGALTPFPPSNCPSEAVGSVWPPGLFSCYWLKSHSRHAPATPLSLYASCRRCVRTICVSYFDPLH